MDDAFWTEFDAFWASEGYTESEMLDWEARQEDWLMSADAD